MNSKNLLPFAIATMVIFTGCEQETKKVDETVISTESAQTDTSASSEVPKQSTQIEFTEKEHDFGNIIQGEMVSHTFTFKNAGNSPLVIMDAKASCGCTVPQWTKDPVAPGETGQIEVKYNGSGSGQVHKTVTVVANTDPAETVLEINANVKPVDLNNKGPFKK